MYHCPDCGATFQNAKRIIKKDERDDFSYIDLVCPECDSGSIYIKHATHCRCCGSKLKSHDIEFCSQDCKNKWLDLKKQQLKRSVILSNSPIAVAVRKIEEYNNRYGTRFSYGNWTELQRMADKKKCNVKKRKKY